MSNKIKHSKIKNTAILFELLTRQITADVLNDKEGEAVSMLKKYFSPKSLTILVGGVMHNVI